MIKLRQSSPNPSGIRFPNDATRSVSFRAVARPKDATAKVKFSIESPGVVFSSNNQTSFEVGVNILAAENTINQSLSFTKTAAGAVLQVMVKARVDEVGASSGFDVFWVMPVLQAPAKETASAGFHAADAEAAFAESVDAASAGAAGDALEEIAPYPPDRSELLHARRLLQTLQAAVDAALSTRSRAAEAPSDTES